MADPIDRDKLRRDAEAATRLRWDDVDYDQRTLYHTIGGRDEPFAIRIVTAKTRHADAAAHIANMDPPTTLALLDQLDAAEKALREIASVVGTSTEAHKIASAALSKMEGMDND